MRIAVTGGSGFIGTRLIDQLLKAGHEIVIIDKNQSKKYPELTTIADIRDLPRLKSALYDVEVIYHLAAEHKDNVSPVSLYYDVNVEGTRNLTKAAVENGIDRIIFTSSVAVYGLNKNNPDETAPVDPFGHYGESKWQAELVLREWQENNPGHYLDIIRPVVVFGENNRGNVFVLLNQIINGTFIMIGNGQNKKSMAYVGNVADMLLFLLREKHNFRLFNYADKPDLNMEELVEIVLKTNPRKGPSKLRIPKAVGIAGGYLFDLFSKISGIKMNLSSVRVKKFTATTQFSADKILHEGFIPATPLGEALKKTIIFEFVNINSYRE